MAKKALLIGSPAAGLTGPPSDVEPRRDPAGFFLWCGPLVSN
jgi:hypothetical protein